MGQASPPFSTYACVHALELSFGHTRELGRLGADHDSGLEVVEDDDSALLSRVQDDPAIHRVTESLFASGVTDSLYVHTVVSIT